VRLLLLHISTLLNTADLYNEQTLLNSLRQGDEAAFARLYQLYGERLYFNLLKMVKHTETAEELLQDIFIQVWEKRNTIEIHTSFRSYLFRIGENKVYDFYRKLRRDKSLYAYIKAAAIEHYSHIEENLLFRENTRLLQNAISTLSPQRRQIFELCKIQGKSYQEVGALLNISTSTINDHIVKATRTIRQYIFLHNKNLDLLILLSLLLADK